MGGRLPKQERSCGIKAPDGALRRRPRARARARARERTRRRRVSARGDGACGDAGRPFCCRPTGSSSPGSPRSSASRRRSRPSAPKGSPPPASQRPPHLRIFVNDQWTYSALIISILMCCNLRILIIYFKIITYNRT